MVGVRVPCGVVVEIFVFAVVVVVVVGLSVVVVAGVVVVLLSLAVVVVAVFGVVVVGLAVVVVAVVVVIVGVIVVVQVFADVRVGFHGGHQDVGVERTLGDQGGVQRAGDVATSLLGTSTRVLTVGEAVGTPVDEAGGGQGFVVREGQHGTVNLLHLVAVLGGLGVPSR